MVPAGIYPPVHFEESGQSSRGLRLEVEGTSGLISLYASKIPAAKRRNILAYRKRRLSISGRTRTPIPSTVLIGIAFR